MVHTGVVLGGRKEGIMIKGIKKGRRRRRRKKKRGEKIQLARLENRLRCGDRLERRIAATVHAV